MTCWTVGSPILPSDVPPMKGQIDPTVKHVLSVIVNISPVNGICNEAAIECTSRRLSFHWRNITRQDWESYSLVPFSLSWHEMVDVASKIEICKANSGKIRLKHFLYICLELLVHFHLLFNGMTECLFSGTFPKENYFAHQQCDISVSSYFRGITFYVLPAKLFEYALLKKTSFRGQTVCNLVLRKKCFICFKCLKNYC